MNAIVDCKNDLKRYVPLSKVVAASIVDMHEDIGRLQQIATHHAARGLKKITRETLKTGIRKAVLTVNQNTRSATLPPDFDTERFVGVIDPKGFKVSLNVNTKIVDYQNIEDVSPPELCAKCNQDKQICEDLTVTETTTLVLVNGITAQQTVIKKLYPDGGYYLETIIPVWDIGSSGIIYTTTKEFVTAIDLKDCGCILESAENIEKIKCLCPDVWGCYFAPCDSSCVVDYGGYKIYEDTGLIYFDKPHSFEKIYLEYYGFMIKKNGQFQVPEVAFETLVNWIKFKWVENKRNVPAWERQWTFNQYRRERDNMSKIIGRISLSQIIQAIGLVPKFDVDYTPDMWCSGSTVSYATVNGSAAAAAAAKEACAASMAAAAAASEASATEGCNTEPDPIQECPCPPVAATKQPFQLAKVAGIGDGPTVGMSDYQHDDLIGALDVNIINVNNTPETVLALQFSFDTVTGILERFQGDGTTPNIWQVSDVLVINYAKIV